MASCTIDFCKGSYFHGFMKAEVRISINDYGGNSEEFIVESQSLTPTLSRGAGEGERYGGRGRHRSLSPLPSLHGMVRGSLISWRVARARGIKGLNELNAWSEQTQRREGEPGKRGEIAASEIVLSWSFTALGGRFEGGKVVG